MTKSARVVAVLSVLSIGGISHVPGVAAQMAKSGDFSGVYGWSFPLSGAVELEKEHMIWGGASHGAFRNDAGVGFLHGTIVVCTSAGEAAKGAQLHNGGNCVASDKDGDKVFAAWSCSECPNKTAGTLKWTGGTGKYAGVKGAGTYQETGLGAGPAGFFSGWSVWKGNYQLPLSTQTLD
jgi:hypothetical protein